MKQRRKVVQRMCHSFLPHSHTCFHWWWMTLCAHIAMNANVELYVSCCTTSRQDTADFMSYIFFLLLRFRSDWNENKPSTEWKKKKNRQKTKRKQWKYFIYSALKIVDGKSMRNWCIVKMLSRLHNMSKFCISHY